MSEYSLLLLCFSTTVMIPEILNARKIPENVFLNPRQNN